MLLNLKKDRTRQLVRGLGNLYGRVIEPTPGASFVDFGNIKGTVVTMESEIEDVRPEHGRLINRAERTRSRSITSNLMQTSKDEIDLLREAKGKVYAIRYYGQPGPNRFQYFLMDRATIEPSVKLTFQPGERLVPIAMGGLYQDDSSFEIPELIMHETGGPVRISDLGLWIETRAWLNEGSSKILDISGWSRHGTFNADFSSIWDTDTAPVFLRFDGSNDVVDFGNVLDDDGSADFSIEFWIRIMGSNGTQQEILSKKAVYADNTDGFAIIRDSSNKLAFKISDGANSATVASTATVLTNTWTHAAIAVDRNGNATWYINGAASNNGSVAGVGNGSCATSLLLGAVGALYGQIDIGGLRIYTHGAGNLPAWATIASDQDTNEKTYYGL